MREKWKKIAEELAELAAEQVFGPKTGEEKKSYAVNFLKGKIPYLTEKEIANLVEAAVFEMNHALIREGLTGDT